MAKPSWSSCQVSILSANSGLDWTHLGATGSRWPIPDRTPSPVSHQPQLRWEPGVDETAKLGSSDPTTSHGSHFIVHHIPSSSLPLKQNLSHGKIRSSWVSVNIIWLMNQAHRSEQRLELSQLQTWRRTVAMLLEAHISVKKFWRIIFYFTKVWGANRTGCPVQRKSSLLAFLQGITSRDNVKTISVM